MVKQKTRAKSLKRALAFVMSAVMTVASLPIVALADNWQKADKVYSALIGSYVGYDGGTYGDFRNYNYIKYTGKNQTQPMTHTASSPHSKVGVGKGGVYDQAICIEAGAPLKIR